MQSVNAYSFLEKWERPSRTSILIIRFEFDLKIAYILLLVLKI